MNLASQATDNAIVLECKKDGLQQRQGGDWSLRFTVAGMEIDQRLVRAAMGTRYQCVLVEIDDDETPVNHKAMERDKWRELGPVKQSGIRCKDPIFWAFLSEKFAGPKITSEEAAAVLVRDVCGVISRSGLASLGASDARTIWYELDNEFQAWKARENG